jgi:hypothetical protein
MVILELLFAVTLNVIELGNDIVIEGLSVIPDAADSVPGMIGNPTTASIARAAPTKILAFNNVNCLMKLFRILDNYYD